MNNKDRILLVENDPDISNLISHQALEPLGYQIVLVRDPNEAIQKSVQYSPDLVIANLNLPGLSGKDLLVALNSQEIFVPVIVVAEKGQESSVIQAFRLGAADYLLWPAREAEIVSAVERVLKQVHEHRARQQLDLQLKNANQELQHRIRELTTIFAVGKAVISITDQRVLFNKIVEETVHVAEADYGWLLLRDEGTKNFLLTAHRNLPAAWNKKMDQPLDDGVSSLVTLSGQSLAINGEPIKKFNLAALGQSTVAVPVKVQKEVVGSMVFVRKANKPFEGNTQVLLEAVADYASISLVNTRLFRALEENAQAAQTGEKRKMEQLFALRQEIYNLLQPASYPTDLLLTGKMGNLTDEQRKAIEATQVAIKRILKLITVDRPSQPIIQPIKQ